MLEKILMLAEKRHIPNREIEMIAGLGQGALSKWGKKASKSEIRPRLDQMLRIARTLGVTIDYLVDEEQEMPPPAGPLKPADEGEEKILWLYRSLGLTPDEAARRLAGEAQGKTSVRAIGEQDVSGLAREEKKRLGFELEGESDSVNHKNGLPPGVEG